MQNYAEYVKCDSIEKYKKKTKILRIRKNRFIREFKYQNKKVLVKENKDYKDSIKIKK